MAKDSFLFLNFGDDVVIINCCKPALWNFIGYVVVCSLCNWEFLDKGNIYFPKPGTWKPHLWDYTWFVGIVVVVIMWKTKEVIIKSWNGVWIGFFIRSLGFEGADVEAVKPSIFCSNSMFILTNSLILNLVISIWNCHLIKLKSWLRLEFEPPSLNSNPY